jgi:hypothetical protein
MTLPTVTVIVARYPGKAVDGTRVRRGDRIAWCRTTRRVLTANPARVDELVAAAAPADGWFDLDRMYEDSCAARCGL